MGILKFDKADVQRLVDHVKAHPEYVALYGQPETVKPGLWLVGDHGVYLMTNTKEKLLNDNQLSASDTEPGRCFVVYAEGINPEKDDSGDWWDRKVETFGGDDGVEFLELEAVENQLKRVKRWLQVNIQPDSLSY